MWDLWEVIYFLVTIRTDSIELKQRSERNKVHSIFYWKQKPSVLTLIEIGAHLSFYFSLTPVGLTPMVTVFRDFLSSSSQPTNTSNTERDHHECPALPEEKSSKLLFANKTEKDILWRVELDQLATSKPNRWELVKCALTFT